MAMENGLIRTFNKILKIRPSSPEKSYRVILSYMGNCGDFTQVLFMEIPSWVGNYPYNHRWKTRHIKVDSLSSRTELITAVTKKLKGRGHDLLSSQKSPSLFREIISEERLPATKSILLLPVRIGEALTGIVLFFSTGELSDMKPSPMKYLISASNLLSLTLERERREIKLQEQENRLQEITSTLPQIVYETDDKGQTLYVNGRILEIMGYDPEELIRKIDPIMLLIPEDRERARNNMMKTLSGVPGRPVEYKALRKDGSTLPVLFQANPIIRDGRLYGSRGLVVDITELKEMEESLRLSEERFRTVADFTHDWEYWMGYDGSILYNSPSCLRITGYSAEDFIGDASLLIKIVHPSDRDLFLEHQQAEMETHRTMNIDFRIITRTGEEKYINHVCQPVYGKEGSWQGLRISNRDITKRIIAEKERETLIKELKEALSSIKTLRGLIPICASCKKIRDDEGYWQQLETYLQRHSDAEFTHGLCPHCAKHFFAQIKNNGRSPKDDPEDL